MGLLLLLWCGRGTALYAHGARACLPLSHLEQLLGPLVFSSPTTERDHDIEQHGTRALPALPAAQLRAQRHSLGHGQLSVNCLDAVRLGGVLALEALLWE